MVTAPRFTPALFRGTHSSHQWTSPPLRHQLFSAITNSQWGYRAPEIFHKTQLELELKPLIAGLTIGFGTCWRARQHPAKSYCFIVDGILRRCSADELLYAILSDGRLIICCNHQTMASLCGFYCGFTGVFSDLHAKCPRYFFILFYSFLDIAF